MTEPWRIHTVVFDLDDTLYPERDYVLSGFAAVDRWLCDHRGLDGFREQAESLFSNGSRGRIFDEALMALGQSPDPELITGMVETYRQHVPQLSLCSDAAEALGWATEAGFNLGLITDGYQGVQERKVSALGLAARIPCRIVTDALGREFWKPSPEAFRRVMAHYGGEASGFVYVADNPRKDFIGARTLGWRTVRIRRQGGEHSAYEPSDIEAAEKEITSLRELKSLLVPAKPKP
jgi:putative hydrolase of the HAD superfamily